jgi:hypothetical protein
MGAAAAVATLIFLLRGDSPSAHSGTTRVRIVPDERLPHELKQLVQRLGSVDPVERAHAILELQALGPRSEAAVPYLARVLPDRSRIRIERDRDGNDVGPLDRGGTGYFTCPGALAARALTHAGGTGIDALLKGLAHKSDDVRRSALDGAGYAADPRLIAPTVRALGDDNGLIREAADAALLRRGPAAIAALSAAIDDDDQRTRLGAASLLARSNDAAATRALLVALNHPAPQVRANVESALTRLDERACIPSLVACLGDQSIRPHAVSLLARMRTAQKTTLLVEALQNSDFRIRAGAAEALSVMKDAAAAEALTKAQHDEQPEVQQAARDALAALQAPAGAAKATNSAP